MTAPNQAAPGSGYQPKASRKKPRRPPKANGATPAAGPLLDRDAILAADDLTSERVPCPEWGGDVLVRALPLAERGEFEKAASDKDSSSHEVMCRIVALCCCNPDGTRMFTLEDAGMLAAKSAPVIMRLMKAATRINAITDADIEELAKN